MKYPNEFEQVFGQVGNSSKTVGYLDADRKKPVEMRVGKTSRDKAKGHIPYRKNIRIWDDNGGGRGKGSSGGQWVKK